jgi:nucleoside-diphosphate-sugar epimerase
VARALIVGCGCRGRELGRHLLAEGWQVRGTTRHSDRMEQIAASGLEAAVADPDRPATVLDLVADVTVVAWLLGSADGELGLIEAIHGPRLERLLEKLVDTPVRGFLYEAAGSVPGECLEGGGSLVRAASERWRIPVELLDSDPAEPAAWTAEAAAAIGRLLS